MHGGQSCGSENRFNEGSGSDPDPDPRTEAKHLYPSSVLKVFIPQFSKVKQCFKYYRKDSCIYSQVESKFDFLSDPVYYLNLDP